MVCVDVFQASPAAALPRVYTHADLMSECKQTLSSVSYFGVYFLMVNVSLTCVGLCVRLRVSVPGLVFAALQGHIFLTAER